ncbi:MAG: protein kinase [candidate division Zixibacteria bacterium]|nr:protein kinase [candidate division Zixibacteria bacterium]
MSSDIPENDDTRTHVVLTKGTMVAHYRISEKIGAGGMGEVYLAEDTELGRRVALKFLPLNLATENEHRARFKREAQAAAKLNHPNIVTIHEVSEFNGRPYIVMEHVEGRSLHDFCHDEPLPTNKIIDTAIQICDGLSKAHKAGIVHRDIKSSNIVVDSDGRPKILDFGLATFKGSEEVTKAGSTIGTVAYMSPEQAQGQKIDHRSDLFSFGIVLYELIAGRTPFKRDSDAATLKAIVNDKAEPLTRYRAEVPDELQRIVNKLLQRDPSLRYQNAADITADLKLLAISGSSPTVPAYEKKKNRKFMVIGAAGLALAATFIVYMMMPFGQSSTDSGTPMLVVLPFENLGSAEDEYFADGITDEITSRLASVSGLGVISRTSAIQYKNSKKSLPEIARELGVDYVLEGTIRWDKSGDTDRVRITPQLIDVSDNTHLWAHNYERALTQIFAVQEEIAIHISDALDLTLNAAERKAIESVPTKNMQAYDYYLRGLEYFNRMDPFAEQMFKKAVELDSTFVPALARLSYFHSIKYWMLGDRTAERIRQIKIYADKALELDPDYYNAHMALGYYYYYVGRHYDKAIKEFEKGLALKPNEPFLLSSVAFIKRRQGKWQEAFSLQKQGLVLDPLSANLSIEFINTCNYMSLYDEGIEEAKRAISLHPDMPFIYANWAAIIYASTGDAEKALKLLEEAQNKTDMSRVKWALVNFAIATRDFDKALKLQKESLAEAQNLFDTCHYYNDIGHIYYLIGDDSKSKACYDSALSCYESVIGTNVSADDSAWTIMSIAEANAGLGRKDEAIRLGEEAYSQIPIERDALVGMDLTDNLAGIYLRVGEKDKALDLLEVMLSKPSVFSVMTLKNHPYSDPLRDHPRYKALIEKFETTK